MLFAIKALTTTTTTMAAKARAHHRGIIITTDESNRESNVGECDLLGTRNKKQQTPRIRTKKNCVVVVTETLMRPLLWLPVPLWSSPSASLVRASRRR